MSFFYLSVVMMDEVNVKSCILCCQPWHELEKTIKIVDWENLKVKASKWKELDKYSNVCDSVNWEEGSVGLVWHKPCKIKRCREENYRKHWTGKKKQSKHNKTRSSNWASICYSTQNNSPKCWNRSSEKSLHTVYERRWLVKTS